MQLKDSALLQTQGFINGQWRDAAGGKTFDVTNPATGEVLAQVADMGADETREAIAIAEKAQIEWRAKTAKER